MKPLHGQPGSVVPERSDQLSLFGSAPSEPTWEVKVSGRTRRLTVRVYPGGRVEIVVPPRTSPKAIEQFVARHRRWIDGKVDAFRARQPTARHLPEQIELRATDERLPLHWQEGAGAGHLLERDGGLHYHGPLDWKIATPVLHTWLLQAGRERLTPWLAEVAAQRGFRYVRTQVRRQRTRWGSCSRSGTISLNVCLLFQTPAVVRYLFIHELSHTQHMDHSEHFWAKVALHEPAWKILDRELTRGWQGVPDWVFG
jgi:predicted metal-dependent hydrolase